MLRRVTWKLGKNLGFVQTAICDPPGLDDVSGRPRTSPSIRTPSKRLSQSVFVSFRPSATPGAPHSEQDSSYRGCWSLPPSKKDAGTNADRNEKHTAATEDHQRADDENEKECTIGDQKKTRNVYVRW